MKIYKVTYYSKQDSSQGFTYHSSRANAQKALAEFRNSSKEREGDLGEPFDDFDKNNSEITIIEFKPTLKGFLEVLSEHAEHNDNG
mgnify:CR=1 FL=1